MATDSPLASLLSMDGTGSTIRHIHPELLEMLRHRRDPTGAIRKLWYTTYWQDHDAPQLKKQETKVIPANVSLGTPVSQSVSSNTPKPGSVKSCRDILVNNVAQRKISAHASTHSAKSNPGTAKGKPGLVKINPGSAKGGPGLSNIVTVYLRNNRAAGNNVAPGSTCASNMVSEVPGNKLPAGNNVASGPETRGSRPSSVMSTAWSRPGTSNSIRPDDNAPNENVTPNETSRPESRASVSNGQENSAKNEVSLNQRDDKESQLCGRFLSLDVSNNQGQHNYTLARSKSCHFPMSKKSKRPAKFQKNRDIKSASFYTALARNPNHKEQPVTPSYDALTRVLVKAPHWFDSSPSEDEYNQRTDIQEWKTQVTKQVPPRPCYNVSSGRENATMNRQSNVSTPLVETSTNPIAVRGTSALRVASSLAQSRRSSANQSVAPTVTFSKINKSPGQRRNKTPVLRKVSVNSWLETSNPAC